MTTERVHAKIIADSIYKASGARITTLEVVMHRFAYAELLEHRALSCSTVSIRSVSTPMCLDQAIKNPMLPVSLGRNKLGVIESSESIADPSYFLAEWKMLASIVGQNVQKLCAYGAHKQLLNRPLEAFLPITVVITATEWADFLVSCTSGGAQPELRLVARRIQDALVAHDPQILPEGDWHLPYIRHTDRQLVRGLCCVDTDTPLQSPGQSKDQYWRVLCGMSASRCAQTSYPLAPEASHGLIDSETTHALQLLERHQLDVFEHQALGWNVTDKMFEAVTTGTSATDRVLSLRLRAEELTRHLTQSGSLCPRWADVRNFRGFRPLRSFLEYKEIELW